MPHSKKKELCNIILFQKSFKKEDHIYLRKPYEQFKGILLNCLKLDYEVLQYQYSSLPLTIETIHLFQGLLSTGNLCILLGFLKVVQHVLSRYNRTFFPSSGNQDEGKCSHYTLGLCFSTDTQ